MSIRTSDTDPSNSGFWDSEALFFDAETYFATLLVDLQQAREEILLETYIFTLDATGKKILEALQAASDRGIRIKLLMDGIGSSADAGTLASALQRKSDADPATEVRIFHPLPWHFSTYRWTMRNQNRLVKLWRLMLVVNHRDHRKLCVIDGKIAWLGSFNITAGDVEGYPVNRHETGARLTGSAVAGLKQNFFQVWQHREKFYRRRFRNFLSNHSLQLRKQKNRALIHRILQAKTRIWISNAYFVPSPALIKALKQAVKQGVDVQVLVPSRSDIAFFPALARTFYADLLATGLRIYEYNRTILHSKTMLIDDMLIVGSTNLNYRSYFHDLELDAILLKPETIRKMETQFIDDRNISNEITLHTTRHFPSAIILVGWISRLLRYWL
jgi:cardiolipin synthase